jgi:hypothetical protein
MTALQPRNGGVEFERGDAFHINQRCLAGLHDFQRLRVLLGIG